RDTPPSKPDKDDVPPPLPPVRRKRSGGKQTKQMIGEGNPISSSVNTNNTLKSSSSPAPVFGDFGNADPFTNENSLKLDPEDKVGSPKNDEPLKDDPFSSFNASDPFAQSQKNFGTETDPFAGADPFVNIGNNAETLSGPFAESQNDSTGGLATGKDPFGGTDPFGNTGSTYLFGDTGITSGTEMLGGGNSQSKSNSEDVGTTADPFGGGDPFAGPENKHMTDVIALGRNLMSPNTDQEIINAFANLPTESATSFNLNVSTSTTDLQNNSHHTLNPTAQSTIISPGSNLTATVAFPAGNVGQPHVTESPEPTYEDICPPPLPSVNNIPPRPPKPPRQNQSKAVHFEPEAIYEDLPNEFWTQELGKTKDQADKEKLELGNSGDKKDSPVRLDTVLGETTAENFGQLTGKVQASQKLAGTEPPFGENVLSSSTPQHCVEDPFGGGDFWAATGNTEQTLTKTGLDETYDDASVGGFVADFGSMTTSSSEAEDIPGQYGNVPALSSENTGQSTPASTSPPKPNSGSKNKKKGKSWVDKYIKKRKSSSTTKEAKDVPDSGLYEEPVQNADKNKKADPLTASKSKPQSLETEQMESDLYEEINVARPTTGVQTWPGNGVVSSIVPEPAPASTSQSKSGSLPLKKP
ncbi:uncharacterized protein LOC110444512, partial [Mizuhopecten yessoensis]|uniref:uncharacterized protein LOC110444512 n=1 Tax=Mizuhopecten yessoensis TaxID=6573 RepID=UPI000B45C4FC